VVRFGTEGDVMGKCLDMIDHMAKAAPEAEGYDKNDINDKSGDFGRFGRLCRTFDDLDRRCPDLVDITDWQQAVADGKEFLFRWGEQAEALGWTAEDLFGLHEPPEQHGGTYRRLSRYDATGLIWFLHGRRVKAITANPAAIEGSSGAVMTFYRRMAQ
jgi:hypothetical protein